MCETSRICSWKIAHVLDNPIRRLIHNPQEILGGHIKPGQTVLDLGCGPGTFSIAMAKMVGESGRVIAVDIQEEMLQILRKKAALHGLESRIIIRKSGPDRIGLSEKVDFALAFYMVHEVPNAKDFLKEIASVLKPNGKLLIVEPKMHVSADAFEKTMDIARQVGLSPISEPKIRFSRSKLFSR
ncbi:MAG: class I SAM-dependent methyltransferase [Methanothrix sp.]|nr:class I SAM-dependent methyltransferase [Methanothrix sp.]MDD4448348.1 class I SAM-dependent methyltransferase [Methanothrix sp.]